MTDDFNPFVAGEILRLCPTTGPQQEIITSAQLSEEANTAFNEAVSIRIDGALDASLLNRCFDTLVDRHEMLRATFSRNARELCLQSRLRPRLQVEDWSACTPEQQARALDELWRDIAISPMNLEEGPLLFAWLLQYGPQGCELVIAAHHLVCDGWSFALLLSELAKLYRSQVDPAALPPAQSFFDFAEQNDVQQIRNADIDYWREQFRNQPPTLDLPLDFVRPRQRTFTARRCDFEINPEVVATLPKAAASMRASLVNTVLAGYFVLLHRLTKAEDIVVGLPVAGQAALKRIHQLGHMVQLLPIRVQLNEATRFIEVVAQVKERLLAASEHPNFTFGNLIEGMTLDRSRVPLIATIFNVDQPFGALDFGNCKGSLRTIPRAAENFELFLNVVQDPGKLTIEATYSTALFSEGSVVSWLGALEHILAQVIQASDTTVGDFRLCGQLSPVQTRVNDTKVDLKAPDVVRAFRAMAQATPEAIAVVSAETQLTYRALDERSDALACLLRDKGIGEHESVAICCERSERMLVAMLAVLKAGAGYLPLDPDFPSERLVTMLSDSGARAVLEDDNAPRGVREANLLHLSLQMLAELPPASGHALPGPNPSRLAYTIYTSGSTGKPKGVRIPCAALINFLESMLREPGCGPTDRVLAVTTLSFDISALELLLPLLAGARVIIATREQAKDGEQLSQLITRHEVTLLQGTPSTWRLLLASHWASESSGQPLRALCGGEPLPADLVVELLPRVGELWNMFGPTETTVWSTCKRITSTTGLVTVGKPIANTTVYLLDSRDHVLPLAVPGELCIGGAGVGLGYHNLPELTTKRFIELPEMGRIYRTGDLAKQLPNGEIQHLGRLDDQVKLRGYRIELGEIEAALEGCQGVQAAAAYLWEVAAQDVRLVACCVPSGGGDLETSSIRKRLREVLPAYMVPQYLLSVAHIPLTANGKVDRRSLPRPELGETKILAKAELRGAAEELIAGVWTSLLKPKRPVSRDDNFFEIGGHSLLALEALRQIEKLSGTRLKPAQLVLERLSSLAEKLGTGKPIDSNTPAVTVSSAEQRQLSPEQLRILRRQLNYPTTICNNLPAAWVISGNLDATALGRSLQRVMERQTALRTLVQESNGVFRQVLVHHQEAKLLEVLDFRNKDNPVESALEDARRSAAQPYRALNQLLFRARLYRLAELEHLFLVVPHQLVFDGWSFDVFLDELAKVYIAVKENGVPALPPLPFEYRDYAHWQAKRQPKPDTLAFHRCALPYVPPCTCERGLAGRAQWRFDHEALERIERFSDQNQLRLHEYFFSAFLTAFAAWRRRSKATVGFPVTGRYSPEVIGQIGSFVSILPCEFELVAGGFRNQATSFAGQMRKFLEHQDLSLGELIAGTPLAEQPFPSFMEASLGMQDVRNRPSRLADLALHQIDMPRGQTELPVEFWVRVHRDGILAVIDFDSALTSANELERLGSLLQPYLQGAPETDQNGVARLVAPDPRDTIKRRSWRHLFD